MGRPQKKNTSWIFELLQLIQDYLKSAVKYCCFYLVSPSGMSLAEQASWYCLGFFLPFCNPVWLGAILEPKVSLHPAQREEQNQPPGGDFECWGTAGAQQHKANAEGRNCLQALSCPPQNSPESAASTFSLPAMHTNAHDHACILLLMHAFFLGRARPSLVTVFITAGPDSS